MTETETVYAPKGSRLVCPTCDLDLYELMEDGRSRETLRSDAVRALNGAPLGHGVLTACPEHGPVWPALVRPDGSRKARV